MGLVNISKRFYTVFRLFSFHPDNLKTQPESFIRTGVLGDFVFGIPALENWVKEIDL